jgi:MFS family permease
VFGFAYGGGVTTMPGLAGDFFGRTSSGAIVGLIFALSGSLAAVGPFVAGAMFDATGSYRTAFLLSALCNVAALALVGVLRPPHREAGRVAAGWRVATGGGDGAAGAA